MSTPNPNLPNMCWAVNLTSGALICIKNGESGFYTSKWSTNSREQNQKIADHCNQQLGVTPLQADAMVNGSIFGWDTPAADPDYLASIKEKQSLQELLSEAESKRSARQPIQGKESQPER